MDLPYSINTRIKPDSLTIRDQMDHRSRRQGQPSLLKGCVPAGLEKTIRAGGCPQPEVVFLIENRIVVQNAI